MGSALEKFSQFCPEPVSNIYKIGSRKRKREISDDESVLQQNLQEPKRKKMVCTAKYIYKTLFLDGRDYDIRVDIMGKEWKLHKIYLQQSPYFASMFSGSWKESNKSYVRIEVDDPNITLQALTVVFGALYPNDEVVIEPCNVVGIIAAASLFQLDGLIEQCLDVMTETVSPLTAVNYYNAACQYSLDSLKKTLINWFLCNLMCCYGEQPGHLKDITPDLMEHLVIDKDLCVIQLEFSLYLLLTSWMVLRIRPRLADADAEELGKQTRKFFRERSKDEHQFLDSEEGKEFVNVFKGLRLEYLVCHHQDMETVLEDRVIPESWMYPNLVNLWSNLLKLDKAVDTGPANLADNIFYKKCMRMGRVIEVKDVHSWKWNFYLMGLDLVWMVTPRSVLVKHNITTTDARSTGNHCRKFMCRVVIISQNIQKQPVIVQDSGVLSVALPNFQEFKLMDFTKDFTYPITVSVNLLLTTPKQEKENKDKEKKKVG